MDGSRARLVDPGLEEVPGLERIGPAARSAPELGAGWAVALGGGWPLALWITLAIQPPPTHPEAGSRILASALTLAFYSAFWVTVFLAAQRHRLAGVGGTITGGIFVTAAVLCPLSGHHELGPWWFGQLAIMTTMLAVSLVAAVHHRRTA
jgi:hypothetical protein